MNDITHNNGEGCTDYFRAKREAIEAGTPTSLAERIGRWITLKWGYKCAEMHTIISRIPFVVVDTDGTVYTAEKFTDFISIKVDNLIRGVNQIFSFLKILDNALLHKKNPAGSGTLTSFFFFLKN